MRSAHILAIATLVAGTARGERTNSPPVRPLSRVSGTNRYQVTTTRDRVGRPRESVEMVFIYSPTGNLCRSTWHKPEGDEIVTIRLEDDGEARSATRHIFDEDGKLDSFARIWKEGETIHIERDMLGRRRRRSREQPPDTRFAVDVSTLALVRNFPFGQNCEWKLFIADFSQVFVNITLRDTGTEWLTVPAGRFRCHHVELIVDLPLYNPRFTYWISAEPPHVLVRHRGRKGPFAPGYTMQLESTNSVPAPKRDRTPAPEPASP